MELFSEHLTLYDPGRKERSILQLLRHCLDHQRYHQDHLRLEQFDILRHAHQGVIDTDYRAQRCSLKDVHTQAVCVMDRQHRHDHGTLRNLHFQTCGILRYISVRQHNAFTLPRRTGSKHDRTELIRIRVIIEASPVLLQQFPERKCMIVIFFLLHGNHRLKLRTAVFRDSRHIFSHFIIYKYRGI